MMDNKDVNVEHALDDLFSDDALDIKNGEVDNINDSSNEKEVEQVDKESTDIISANINEKSDLIEKEIIIDENEELPATVSEDNIPNDIDTKKIVLYILVGFVVGLLLIFIIANSLNKQEKVVNCTLEAEDKGYKIVDEYKITYASNNIKKVNGTYTYKSKTTEYNEQIQYIKEEKLKAIINSNGMPGFTYLYELSEDYFKVDSYLNFEEMEFKTIDNNNWEQQPLSYFTFNSKTTFKDLKQSLEKNGYTCVNSK